MEVIVHSFQLLPTTLVIATMIIKELIAVIVSGITYICTFVLYYLFIFDLACSLLCEAGYALNASTCTCYLSNVCQQSTCQSGCTLVSNYTCDCTGMDENISCIIPALL